MKGRLALIASLFCLSACSGSESPARPDATPQQQPPAPPTTFTLNGTVVAVAPPANNVVQGATVTITGGTNAGATTTTNAAGQYSFSSLPSGLYGLAAEKSGFATGTREITIANTGATADFTLNYPFRQLEELFTAPLSGGNPTCSDAAAYIKPCNVIFVPVHNNGTLTATLTWTPGSGNDLDLSLFKNGVVVVSSLGVTSSEFVSTAVTAGTYEFRVTYYSGRTITNFNLNVSHPN